MPKDPLLYITLAMYVAIEIVSLKRKAHPRNFFYLKRLDPITM